MKIIIKSTLVLLLLVSSFSFAQTEKPQTPKAPFDYTIEDVTFINKAADSIKLAGTLTVPKNIKNPAVAILINGSGAHDRDCNILGHKPFWVIADYLTNNGIAVLRFDERGTAKSEGDFSTATTYDLALDVEAGISFLKNRKDIDSNKIGLIGHSEGGAIAPIIASKNKDVAFIVLLAGPGVRGDKIMYTQNEKILNQRGYTKAFIDTQLELNTNFYKIVIEKENDSISNTIKTYLDNYLAKNKDNKTVNFILNDFAKKQFASVYSNPWFREFIRFDPKPYLEKTTCPVLALNGSKDVQVLPEYNLPEIKKHLETAKNKDITVKELEGLNHLFQTATTGAPSEYGKIEETFSPLVLQIIVNWINDRF